MLPEPGGDAYYSLWEESYLENAPVIRVLLLVSQVWNIIVGDVDLWRVLVYTSLARSSLNPIP